MFGKLLFVLAQMDCYVSQGDRLGCVFSDLTASTGGEAMFGLLLAGTIILVFYLAPGGSVGLAAVILTLLGVVLVPMLPGNVSALAGTIIILGLGAGVFTALRKYAITTQ